MLVFGRLPVIFGVFTSLCSSLFTLPYESGAAALVMETVHVSESYNQSLLVWMKNVPLLSDPYKGCCGCAKKGTNAPRLCRLSSI